MDSLEQIDNGRIWGRYDGALATEDILQRRMVWWRNDEIEEPAVAPGREDLPVYTAR